MNRVVAACTLILFLLTPFSVRAQGGGTESQEPKLASATDLKVPAGAILLQLQRQLATGQPQRGLLGTRWRLNWESHLSRSGGLIHIEDWAGIVSFTQVGQQPEYANASGGHVTFTQDGRAVHTTPDGGSESFDAAGRLVERTYHHGNKALLHYTAQGSLSRVEGPGASFLQFTSDSAGHVIQVESSTGSSVRYAYDGDNLTQVQINSGAPLRYSYDARGSLVKIEDPQIGSLEIAYDSKRRVTSYRWADGSEQRFEYDDTTNTKRVIEANGATTVTEQIPEMRRTEITDPLGNKTAIQFDEAGHPVSVTGPADASARMSYDTRGRIVAAEDALGHTTRYEYAGESTTLKAIVHPDGTRQEFEYDDSNDLTAIKVAGKIVSALTYNPNGSIASAKEPGAKERKFTYYPNGLVKSEANALGEATQFEYDRRGNLIRETNPLGGVTVRSFDRQDRLVTLTDPAGGTTRYEYDYGDRLTREVDAAGGVTKFEYDARGRLAAETNQAGQVTRYEYSSVDKLIKTIWPDLTAETYRYDLAGNLVERTDRLGRIFRFERDPLGQVTRERWPSGLEVRYRYNAAGNLQAVEGSGGAKSECQTDALGRNTALINPAGGRTQYQYDSLDNLLRVTDPLGRVKQFAYTADGDLAQVGEASRDEARYEYDAAGRIVAIHRPSGGVTRFTYDRMGNLLTATDPLGNGKAYSYDNAGRLINFKDAANRVTRYVYDKAGQKVEKQLPNGKRVAYKYDVLGRMIEADDGAFPVRMSYDQAGNLKQVEYAAIHKAVTNEYDAQGLRTKMIAPDGRENRYEYDSLKRLSTVVLPGGKKITLSYDEKNRMQSVAYPNGITGRWDYDADGQIAKISYKDRSGKAVAGSSYRYDAAGNPVERQDTRGQSSRFAYDSAGQLLEETNGDGAVKYAYSAGGNRASITEGARVSQYKHDAADRIIAAGAEQLSYDANGNLISRKGPSGVTSYEYDTENQLVKVVTPDGATTTYGYAPTGERVWRRDQSGVTYFLYDGLNLIAELSNDLLTRTTYVHALGIDRPLAMLQENQSYYYAADRLGSITHLTDEGGKVAAAYSYGAFGNIKARQGTVANPFVFIGRELDPTGLYYFRARYYDAALGRFVSEDSISAGLDQPLDQNAYLYVRNNPLRFVDPFGLDVYTPEWLASQTSETLHELYNAASGSVEREQLYSALRSRGLGTPEADFHFYDRPLRQPDGSLKPAWKPGSPPDIEGVPPAGSQPQPQVVGRPGAAPRNLNQGNTNDAIPQPRPAGSNTQQVGGARNGGNTQRAPAAGGAGSGGGFWSTSVRPGFLGAAAAASLLAAAADCIRNGVESCGPKIAGGVVIGGIVKMILPKAAGPIGTLIAGAMGWWQVGKEALNQRIDTQQRDQQAQARLADAQALIQNRDKFNHAVAALRARIDALRKKQADLNAKTSQAQQELDAAKAALDQARTSLDKLSNQAKELDASKLCDPNPFALNSQVEALASQAETAYDTIGNLLNDARQSELDCEAAQDEATAKQKAAAIRTKYDSAKQLAQAMPDWKTQAEQKNNDLKKGLAAINDFKTKQADLNATKAEITSALAKVHTASFKLQALFNGDGGISQSATTLDTDGPKLRGEIDKLAGIFQSGLPPDMEGQITDLYGLVASATKHDPPVDFYKEALGLETDASQLTNSVKETVGGLDSPVLCDGSMPADGAIQRIDSALQKAQNRVSDDSDLPKAAQICEASAKCIPLINQSRQLLEQLQIEEGQAAMEQARQAGCNVAGLETALNYYGSVRDAVAVLNSAKGQCEFQKGLDIAKQIPQSIQNNSFVANAITEVTAGLAAQQQVDDLISKAINAASAGNTATLQYAYEDAARQYAAANGYFAQADRIAAPYPCLVEKLKGPESDVARVQPSSNSSSGGQAPPRTVDQLPEDKNNTPADNNAPPATSSTSDNNPTTPANTSPSQGIRTSLGGFVGTVNLPPTVEQIPEDHKPTTPANIDPGQSTGTSLGGAGGTVNLPRTVEQIPEDNAQNQPAATNNPALSAQGNSEASNNPPPPSQGGKPPTDFWKKLGAAIGTAIAQGQNQPNPQPPPPPPPNQGGGSLPRGQNPPPPPPPRNGGNTGGSGGTTSGQGIDLSGTWSATYTVPMTGQPCRFQVVLSRVAAGQWQGPLDYACDENPRAASAPPIRFKTQATIQISGPGRIHLSYNSPRDGVQQADGTYTNSQMNFGGSAGVTYTRR